MGICVTRKYAHKYCINIIANWLSVDVAQCYNSLKVQTCYDAKVQRYKGTKV